jgi:putative DNA primase/helicase
MNTPDQAVLSYMRQFGLDPGIIEWTGKWVSFHSPGQEGRKRSASYRAFADPPVNVQFRCFKTGVDEHWWAKNGKSDAFDPEKWAQVQKEREEERQIEWAKAAKKARKRWDAAGEPSNRHPYLVAKGIEDPQGIRQEGTTLLVPMKSFDMGAPIVSLQEIHTTGEKRFMKGCRAAGTRTTIGSGDYKDKLYMTEGWATGMSIHEVTGDPVVVAFSSNDLMGVAREMKQRRPQAEIIIAADNDRWSSTPKGMNPGVIAAREAASAIDGLVAIPDFVDLTGKPTDFNDLLLREGEDAVRQWIDPAVSHRAIITPPVDGTPPSDQRRLFLPVALTRLLCYSTSIVAS